MATDFDILTAKLEWAKQHLFKLSSRWRKFIDEENGCPILSEDNPNTGDRRYYVGNILPIPADIPLITGDAIHNLRSALDHLAYELVSIHTKGKGPFDKGLYFPIGENAKDFCDRLERASKVKTKPSGVIQRIGDDAIKHIRGIEPYDGGASEFLWHLHQLDIIDKHHLLVTVTFQNSSQTMPPAQMAKMRSQLLGIEWIPTINDSKWFLTDVPIPRFSLETDDTLDIIPKAQVQNEMNFPIEIAFGEPEIVKGKPVLDTLNRTADMIYTIFMEFSSAGLLT
jgi:hypothetical protein